MKSIVELLKIASLAGVVVRVIIPKEVVETLRATCFRGKEKACAGNSSRWDSPEDMLKDSIFLEPFKEIVYEAIRGYWPLMLTGVRETVSIQLDPALDVGWLPAVPREKINGASLHLTKIGDRAQGMAVAVTDLKHPAPRTNLFHMELDFRVDFNLKKIGQAGVALRILGMGIGQDLGPLEGDLVHPFHVNGEFEPRQVVFFHPHHVGGSDIIPLEP